MHIIAPLQLPNSASATQHSAYLASVTALLVPTYSKWPPSHWSSAFRPGLAVLPCCCGPQPSSRLPSAPLRLVLPKLCYPLPPKQTRRHVLHLLCRRTRTRCMALLALPARRSVTLITRQPHLPVLNLTT
ncbi:hypothetical protein EJ04DRAFT_56037 [Polyplosphaeria fusca]|uniref:Uncharacterized protein n=1 Tax=Polyplosphaeria fusca TaxID=682080 RepID=A0A9P4QS87_9PLEO|nr:hypothetical protein EJ04DRAFT_56037 [Polyplosphaeria fusca]